MPHKDRATRNEYNRNWARRRIEKGICPECGSKIDRKGSLCRKCADRKTAHSKITDTKRNRNYPTIRLKLFQKLSGKEVPECKYCGCDVYAALEINHKKGGGQKDHKKNTAYTIMREICDGKRDLNDYEVTCKVCNWAYYAQQKWGLCWNIKFIKQMGDKENNSKPV